MYTRGPSTQVADTRTQWGGGGGPHFQADARANTTKIKCFTFSFQRRGCLKASGAACPPGGLAERGPLGGGGGTGPQPPGPVYARSLGTAGGGWGRRAGGEGCGASGRTAPWGLAAPWGEEPSWQGSLEQQQQRDWPGLPAGGLPGCVAQGLMGRDPTMGGDPAMAAQGREACWSPLPSRRRPGWTGGAGLGSEQRIRAGQLAPSTSAPVHQPPQPPARALATCWAGRVLSQRVVLCVDI